MNSTLPQPAPEKPDPPRVALISPLPPAPSGVAEYSAHLCTALSRLAGVDALSSPPDNPLPQYDVCVYQLGNNALHAGAYQAALEIPGVAVLHDAVLHHLLLGVLSREQYVEEFVYNYGEWLRDFAADLWRDRAYCTSDARYFDYPMIRRIVERSRAVVVHNPKARRLVLQSNRQGSAAIDVVEIPHYVMPPALPGQAEIAARKRELGIPGDAVVISCFGYLRPTKRLGPLLQAVRMLTAPYRLLLVGNFVSNEYEETIEPLLQDARVIRLPHVPDDEFWRLAAATDVCVNLRHPSAGETSAIAIKLMALGKPVVVTDAEEVSRFPDLAVVRVDAGECETEMLAHYLQALATDPDMCRLIGDRAAAYINQHHSLDRAAEQYIEVIRRVAAR